MKNITLAIDQDLLEAARKYAAKRNTTVNAIVREHLSHLVMLEQRSAKARAELVRLSGQSTARLGPDYNWDREEIYAERLKLSGHERLDLRSGGKGRRSGKKETGK